MQKLKEVRLNIKALEASPEVNVTAITRLRAQMDVYVDLLIDAA